MPLDVFKLKAATSPATAVAWFVSGELPAAVGEFKYSWMTFNLGELSMKASAASKISAWISSRRLWLGVGFLGLKICLRARISGSATM
jgi:hypothetical protein